MKDSNGEGVHKQTHTDVHLFFFNFFVNTDYPLITNSQVTPSPPPNSAHRFPVEPSFIPSDADVVITVE